MRKFRIPLIAICFLLLAVEGYATDFFSVGKSADDNLYKITNTAIVEGARGDYTLAVATDATLTALESGIVLIAEGNTEPFQVNLPAASLGLRYTIVAGATTATLEIQPQDADTIVYHETLANLDAGDELDSPGATGDSITLICGAANRWFIESMIGTWTDGGAN